MAVAYFYNFEDVLTDDNGNNALTNSGGVFSDTDTSRGLTLSDADTLRTLYTIPDNEIDIEIRLNTTSIDTVTPKYINTIISFCNSLYETRGISLVFSNDSGVGDYQIRLLDRESIGLSIETSSENIFSLNTYYKIRYVQNITDKTIKVYLDDTIVINATYTGSSTIYQGIQFGNEATHTGYDLDGTIDHIKLYQPPSSLATVTVSSTASASNVGTVYPSSSATATVTATASAYDATASPKSSATVSVTATTSAYDANIPASSATVTVLATAKAYIAVADIVKFRFVQEIEQPPTQAVFKFIQEIEQPSTSTIIERTNV